MLSRFGLRARSTPRLAWLAAAVTAALTLVTFMRSPVAQENAAGAAELATRLQSRLDALDPQVRYLKDRKDIFDVMKRYTRGADRHDKELVRSAFWPEATISFGTPLGRDEYVDREERELAGYAAHQHHVTGQTIDIDGDTAHVESYVVYFLVPRDRSADSVGPATMGKANTKEKTRMGSGRYIERWERRNGDWKILVREYVEDLALLGETVDLCTNGGCLGSWDRNDLSYVRPLQYQSPERRQARGDANRQPHNPQGTGR
jgi:SnoaL-like domain